MGKIANFLVKYRKACFFGTLVVTLAAACLLPFVNINMDMTKYIPSYLQSKIGMDLMSEEFGDQSLFRVMFESIPEAEQDDMAERLAELPGVIAVEYDSNQSNEDYHKGRATLYEVTVEGGTYSQEASDAHIMLREFGDESGYLCYLDSAVIDAKMDNLSIVIFFAVVILIIILFIMCASWFEPVLLLATIGIAVLLNMGTNIIFDSVSDVTFSIAGVLQLALSLDYSIILLNRYRSEREHTKDAILAMKQALQGAFKSVVSSSVTTIVGLVCLVFMSFTIGRDIGLVLAKGVLFSLICVFTVTPCLVIWFDKLLKKTHKRSLRPSMKRTAAFSYRFRIPIFIVFICLFVSGFLLRNYAEASFVSPSMNPDKEVVQAVFPAGSQVIVVYDGEDEDKVEGLVQDIETMDGVKSVSSYASTIGKEYTASELAAEMDLDSSFVSMLYYYKEHGKDFRPMSINTLASLIVNDISQNPSLSEQVADYDISGLSSLQAMTNASAISAQRTAGDMAYYLSYLGGAAGFSISAEEMEQLYLLYFTKGPGSSGASSGTMSLPVFVSFLVNNVLDNPQFSGYFTPEQAEQVRQLAAYTDVTAITTQLDISSLAEYVGIHEILVGIVCLLAGKCTCSVQEFFHILDTYYSWILPEEKASQITQVIKVIDNSVAGTQFSAAEMADFLSMDLASAQQLYAYYAFLNGGSSSWTINAYDLMTFLASDTAQAYIGEYVDVSQINTMIGIMNEGLAGTQYNPSGMVSRLSSLASSVGMTSSLGALDENSVTLLYLYRDAKELGDPNQTESLEEIISFLANYVVTDPLFAPFISQEMIDGINMAEELVTESKKQLIGLNSGRIIIKTSFGSETDEMMAFLEDLNVLLGDTFTEPYYLVGEGPMVFDMYSGFMKEFNIITLITAVAIFLIVLISFRNLLIPILLVSLIQGSYCWVMALNGLAGNPMYYTAIIVVQAILMGATIDYAILFTSQYRERREEADIKKALAGSFKASMPTFLTSGLILVVVTFILGIAMGGSAVAKICLTLSEGAAVALIFVTFILPGVLTACDRLVVKQKKYLSKH